MKRQINRLTRVATALLLGAAWWLMGCEGSSGISQADLANDPYADASDRPSSQDEEDETATTGTPDPDGDESEDAEPRNGPEEEDASDSADAIESDEERQVARAGVGQKGQGYGGGAISEPARVYFGLRERIIFQVQLPQAMQAYKALHGKGPSSHDEFMQKVVRDNSIKLPELPSGASYVYDPDEEELFVRKNPS